MDSFRQEFEALLRAKQDSFKHGLEVSALVDTFAVLKTEWKRTMFSGAIGELPNLILFNVPFDSLRKCVRLVTKSNNFNNWTTSERAMDMMAGLDALHSHFFYVPHSSRREDMLLLTWLFCEARNEALHWRGALETEHSVLCQSLLEAANDLEFATKLEMGAAFNAHHFQFIP